MLSGKEKMWVAFIVGTLVQSLDIVASVLIEGQGKIAILTIAGIVGTVGQSLGVYQIANTPEPVAAALISTPQPVPPKAVVPPPVVPPVPPAPAV